MKRNLVIACILCQYRQHIRIGENHVGSVLVEPMQESFDIRSAALITVEEYRSLAEGIADSRLERLLAPRIQWRSPYPGALRTRIHPDLAAEEEVLCPSDLRRAIVPIESQRETRRSPRCVRNQLVLRNWLERTRGISLLKSSFRDERQCSQI